jgi:hypothetical protein
MKTPSSGQSRVKERLFLFVLAIDAGTVSLPPSTKTILSRKIGGARSFVQPKVRSTKIFQTSPTRKRAVFLWRK